jgi:hypothetical protein
VAQLNCHHDWPTNAGRVEALVLPPGTTTRKAQAMVTDTVRHGPTAPVFSLSRHTRTDAARPETLVTFVVMTTDANWPGAMNPGSQEGLSELMAEPLGSTHGGLVRTLAWVTLVVTAEGGVSAAEAAIPGTLAPSAIRAVALRKVTANGSGRAA